jgi:hypothetical protein
MAGRNKKRFTTAEALDEILGDSDSDICDTDSDSEYTSEGDEDIETETETTSDSSDTEQASVAGKCLSSISKSA